VLNPPQFALQLAANSALYLPGALLVREAKVRWKKGWATVLLLGAAYGILEEGIALSTLYDSNANPVGKLGFYGHWLSVSWVWTAGIVLVHMLYSIALPLLLLRLALPSTEGMSLLGHRGIFVALGVLGLDVALLAAMVTFDLRFWMGWPAFVGSWVAIGALVLAARLAPSWAIHATTTVARVGPRRAFVLGLCFFVFILLPEYVPLALGLSPLDAMAAMYLMEGMLLLAVLRVVGVSGNERVLIGLASGILLPVCIFGVLAELPFAAPFLADLLMLWFLRRLWRRYAPLPPRA